MFRKLDTLHVISRGGLNGRVRMSENQGLTELAGPGATERIAGERANRPKNVQIGRSVRSRSMEALRECHADVVDLYGYKLQVAIAISLWHEKISEMLSSPPTTRSNQMSFGQGAPNRPGATYQYRRSFGHLLDTSASNGMTPVIHRRSVVTLLYAAWEHTHRRRIAEEVGFQESNDLKSDVFQDVGVYRHAILHRGNKLQKEPKVFRFFGKGEVVSLTNEHVDIIFRGVVDELNRIGREHYGMDPRFSFEQPMN